MAWSLNEATFGELVDPFDGMSDLEECIIHAVRSRHYLFGRSPAHDARRAVRFAIGLYDRRRPSEAIRRNAERIRIVSRERIATELNKIVLSPVPSMGFELLELTGLAEPDFPRNSTTSKGVEKRGKHAHKDNFSIRSKCWTMFRAVPTTCGCAGPPLLHDIGKPQKAYDPKDRLDVPRPRSRGLEDGSGDLPSVETAAFNEHMKFVQKLVFLHLRPIILSEDLVTDSAVRRLLFEAGDDVEALMILCEADITSGIDAKVKRYLANFELVPPQDEGFGRAGPHPQFPAPITGEFIMQTYGIGPCRVHRRHQRGH